MVNLQAGLPELPERHFEALLWFHENAGTEVASSEKLPDGTSLVLQKGIYKPAWSDYALSIRSNINGPYEDGTPISHPDGTWSLRYFQENADPGMRDTMYTNRGLLRCQDDDVPVGVLLQVSRNPSRYRVLGLALVVGWEDGYFLLESYAPSPGDVDTLILALERGETNTEIFDPALLEDARKRTLRNLANRQGQPGFRRRLLNAYNRHCAISHCDVEEVLEACHIVRYSGPESNDVRNGILLRPDLHTLFDLGLIGIDPDTHAVLIDPRVQQTSYSYLAGVTMKLPADKTHCPSPLALKHHRNKFGL